MGMRAVFGVVFHVKRQGRISCFVSRETVIKSLGNVSRETVVLGTFANGERNNDIFVVAPTVDNKIVPRGTLHPTDKFVYVGA